MKPHNHRRRFIAVQPFTRIAIPLAFLLLLSATAVAQTTSADSARMKRLRDSLIQAVRDSMHTADSAGRHAVAPPQSGAPADTQQTMMIFKGADASADISRGVVAGGMVTLRFSQPIPLTVTPVVTLTRRDGGPGEQGRGTYMLIQQYLDSGVVVRIPDSLANGSYEVDVAVPGSTPGKFDSLLRPQLLKVERVGWILIISFIPIILLALLIGFICVLYKTPQGQMRYNAWKLLFLEPQNQTYSLSRAQFVAWTIAISASYVFLFVARGLVESVWAFPPLAGFAITFLISLGTLVASQATTMIKGAKGSGEMGPSIADLVVHGGVLALERVQQVLWTIIAIGMFLWIVYKSYTTATELPVVPNELLYLMGISSAGYIAGKAARKPGPIISNVTATAGSVYLTIEGQSLAKDGSVWVDGTQLPEKGMMMAADPNNPNEFARSLQVVLADPEATLAGWYGATHNVVIVNPDGQRSEWRPTPTIISVTAGAATGTQIPLAIEGHYIGSDATWDLDGAKIAPGTTPTRSPSVPNIWNLTVIPVTAMTSAGQPLNSITVRDASGRESTYKWQPVGSTAASTTIASGTSSDESSDTGAVPE